MWVSGHTPLCTSGDQMSRFFSFRHVDLRNGTSVTRVGGSTFTHRATSTAYSLVVFTVCFYSLFLLIRSDIDFLFIVASEFLFKIVHLNFESVN